MRKTISVIAGVLLAATMGGTALAGNGHGKGSKNGGNPNSQAGGLPALAAKVAALQTQVGTLQTEVGTLQGQVTTLKGQNNWAVVGSDGTVARQNGAATPVAVTHTSNSGLYEVVFNTDVSGCAFTATLDQTGVAIPAPVGFINVSLDQSDPEDIEVQTYDSTQAPADGAFELYVSCP
jgi:TolA-binding protein